MLISMEMIKFKQLSAAVKILNDSKLLPKPIMTVGQTKELIVKAFVDAVQSIPDDKDGNWTGPVEVATYYSEIVVPEPVADEPKAKKEKGEKKAKAPKEPKVPGAESRPKMLARKVAELGKKATAETLIADAELLARYDGHARWIENDFKKLQEKK
jgi:hypothetical protein